MNTEHLRRALKSSWLTYYRNNRHWITRLGVWVNCQGERRPSSSFILGSLSTLEPQLTELLPLVVDLSCNPDRIVIALGLNFNPEDELAALAEIESPPTRIVPAQPPRPISQAPSQSMSTVNTAPQAPKLLPSSPASDLSHLNQQAGQKPEQKPEQSAEKSTEKSAEKSEFKTHKRRLDTAQLGAHERPNRDNRPRQRT
jgi:hypothetical protein